ncbi:MAG: hypothetical protein ACI9LE_000930 [Paraglaciecola sp.]|jgi:hypothetical protein
MHVQKMSVTTSNDPSYIDFGAVNELSVSRAVVVATGEYRYLKVLKLYGGGERVQLTNMKFQGNGYNTTWGNRNDEKG